MAAHLINDEFYSLIFGKCVPFRMCIHMHYIRMHSKDHFGNVDQEIFKEENKKIGNS